jgi:hypothetical protein
MKIQITLATIGCTLMTMLLPIAVSALIPIGTNRKPQTCPSRKSPAKGAPSLAQAKKYFTCHAESEQLNSRTGEYSLNLIENLTMQISSTARRFNPATDSDPGYNNRLNKPLGLNADKPVYDIQGNYTKYWCNNSSYQKPGANCKVYKFVESRGICFQNSFGDWHCVLLGRPENGYDEKGAPPQ